MKNKKEYLMPDYYNTFSCKMGRCRSACCEGWPINFSIEDYFRLSTCNCTEELRRRIDTGIKVSLSPTPDVYAQILPRYDGNCPMRLDDGRCSIQAEMGEEALADVCRLYPRGLRIEPDKECSCSNSCEGVLELLFSREKPIEFVKGNCPHPLPPMGKRGVTYPVFGLEQEIRLHLIKIIQNRKLPLFHRIISLGLSMKSLEEIIEKQDKKSLDLWFDNLFEENLLEFEISDDHLKFGINILEAIIEIINLKSESVKSYGEEALEFFTRSDDLLNDYISMKNHFETAFPSWEIYFEHMISNHMFFEQFPFQDRPVTLWNEFISLCAVYSLMRFLSIGYMSKRESLQELVDMFSAVFRSVDHTSFDTYAAKTLKRLECTTPEKLFSLIIL